MQNQHVAAVAVAKVSEDIIQQNIAHIDQASFLLRSLHSPIRQKIISILLTKGKCPVKDLCEEMDVKQSIMSQNLAILRTAGVVVPRRTGKMVYYSINENFLTAVMKFVQELSSTTNS